MRPVITRRIPETDSSTLFVAFGPPISVFVQPGDREMTIIDGNQNGRVVRFIGGEDSTAVLSGFTITNGNEIS